ncbi:putative kinesin-ii 85 kda subunit protein [Daldinia childiae]|uniref:putative kinesin-ii 85 kda subunit protein n=1 Tax=Daldinia childiae TaxID=326645 RepID=UPI0014476DF3|nr:putative kinesin-ii 85 kda subunit protein [Daldinia childiae]KAF3058463.1 putative kinesin-ii 85 kda subunit protein [Daldinia childiae]
MRPAPIKRVGDLWRMNSLHSYVKGEENLSNWGPRGVSLIGDYITARKKKRRITEIAAAQLFLKKIGLPEPKKKLAEDEDNSDDDISPELQTHDDDQDSINALLNDTPETSRPSTPKQPESIEGDKVDQPSEQPEQSSEQPPVQPQEPEYNEHEILILNKCIKLWLRHPDPTARILGPANTTPPSDGVAPESVTPPRLISTVIRVPKNPKVLKGGYLLVPNNDYSKWVKRFVELRRPYLHIHNVSNGDEVAIVSLRNSRVDSQPEILSLFNGHDDEPDGLTPTNGNTHENFQPGHHRTPSGRTVSTVWSGNSRSSGPSLGGLNERLQAGVFAVYGTDNTWLFAARNEREKLDWISRIDQSYFSGSTSVSMSGSGAVSPQPRNYTIGAD